MASKKRVSLRDVAESCGVSVATVSRVINGKGRFSDATRDRVMAALRREGYVSEALPPEDDDPFVGIVVSSLDNELIATIAEELTSLLWGSGIAARIVDGCSDAEREAIEVRRLRRAGAAGLILVMCRNCALDMEVAGAVPAVYLDTPTGDGGSTFVGSDNYVGGQLVAQELIRKGCTAPIVINNRGTTVANNARVQGFLHEFAKAGIEVGPGRVIDPEVHKQSFAAANELVTYLWTKGERFDAVYACNDWRAYGALVALRQMGVTVPDEVRVVGYDGIRISRFCDQPITTVKQDGIAVAGVAFHKLAELMHGTRPDETKTLVPVRLVVGRTT